MSTSSRRRRWSMYALAMLLATAAMHAGATAPDEVSALLPRLQQDTRADLQRRASQWAGWSEAQRVSFQQRLHAWDALPRAERDATREHYHAWRDVPAAERADVMSAASRFKMLPAEHQQALRERFDALDGSERRGWLLGPVLGGDYPALQPLLAQVPLEEHASLMRVLRGMTASQREDLAVLIQRSAPQDRARLRSELVNVDADSISDWLWVRLDR